MSGTIITTMEINANISDVLREMVTFLECLRDVQLPLALESFREKLLGRTKNTIRTTMMICSSPEPYLNMNAGPKTILLTKKETDTEEYIGMEESPQKQNHQDYYETFEPKEMTPIVTKHAESQRVLGEQEYGENSQVLMSIYKNLSAAQCKNNCHKYGPLHWKNGKIFSERRPYYIALIGSHLLIYRSEQHSEPCDIYSIRGYMARSTPNLLPRNGQKSKSAFEIYCPGSKTLQFIARTPKDMEQWTAKICEIGCKNEDAKINEEPKDHESKGNASNESPVNHCKDKAMSLHQNAHKLADNVKKKSIAKGEAKINRNEAEKNTIESPPPLPARIPRRILPSVSPNESMPSYRSIEDYDDDDNIYHKIEDLQNGLAYQNVILAKRQHANVDDKDKEAEYDDVHASKGKKEAQAQEEKFDKISVEEEMYDDIFVLSRVKMNTEGETRKNGDYPIAIDDGEESFYDDVKNLPGKSTKEHVKDQTETSSKFLQKRSFLERVWNRKESSGKTDKRLWGNVSSSPIQLPSAIEVKPTYNDISDLMLNQESLTNNGEEELSEYNYPPHPRPIYTKSIFTMNQIDPNLVEELYDDVSACRAQYSNNQQTIMQSTQESCANLKEIKNDEMELRASGNLIEKEVEHYQSPRSDLRVDDVPEYQNEELYDDIALCANFKTRQRDINEKKDSEDGKFTVSSDKKSWNRFSMNKKWRSGEPACLSETSRGNIIDCEDIDDSVEANGTSKRNTFQKLISKMENSLAKVSVRNPTSFPMSKSSIASNNS